MRRMLFTILVICIGCGSIPSVVFVPDDASAGGDGGSDGGDDSAGFEGGSEAGGGTVCQGTTFPSSVTCCQSLACIGNCRPPACKNECENLGCSGGKVCCLGSQAHCVTPDVEPCQ